MKKLSEIKKRWTAQLVRAHSRTICVIQQSSIDGRRKGAPRTHLSKRQSSLMPQANQAPPSEPLYLILTNKKWSCPLLKLTLWPRQSWQWINSSNFNRKISTFLQQTISFSTITKTKPMPLSIKIIKYTWKTCNSSRIAWMVKCF